MNKTLYGIWYKHKYGEQWDWDGSRYQYTCAYEDINAAHKRSEELQGDNWLIQVKELPETPPDTKFLIQDNQ
jgi:hypothetical protein